MKAIGAVGIAFVLYCEVQLWRTWSKRSRAQRAVWFVLLATIGGGSVALLSACAPMPRYQYQSSPIAGANVAPKEQAITVCRARANTAASSARAATSTQLAQQQQNGPVSCTTTGYGATKTTNCLPLTTPNYLADAQAGDSAAGSAMTSEYIACMGSHGYRVQRVCVANCK